MKTTRFLTIIIAAILMITAVFALSGCGKKPIGIDELKSILEAEGYDIDIDTEEEEGAEITVLEAYKSESGHGYDIIFVVVDKDDENAGKFIDTVDSWMKEQAENIGKDAITNKFSKDYVCVEGTSSVEYIFEARVDNTFILFESGKDGKDEGQRLMKKIGYK